MNNFSCNNEPFTPEKPWTPCEYIPPAIETAKVKKDEHGNFFIMINDDGKWRGATLDSDTRTLTFSY